MYRIKQFYWHIISRWKKIDYKLINMYLNKNEKELFNKLNNSEKQHCIRVCYDAIDKIESENININKEKLARVALLHDVGKIKKSLNVIDKSILVLLDKATKGKIKKYNNIEKIDIYYNHPLKGVKILQEINNYDSEFLDVIMKHHEDSKKKVNNIYLEIIKECDNKN